MYNFNYGTTEVDQQMNQSGFLVCATQVVALPLAIWR